MFAAAPACLAQIAAIVVAAPLRGAARSAAAAADRAPSGAGAPPRMAGGAPASSTLQFFRSVAAPLRGAARTLCGCRRSRFFRRRRIGVTSSLLGPIHIHIYAAEAPAISRPIRTWRRGHGVRVRPPRPTGPLSARAQHARSCCARLRQCCVGLAYSYVDSESRGCMSQRSLRISLLVHGRRCNYQEVHPRSSLLTQLTVGAMHFNAESTRRPLSAG